MIQFPHQTASQARSPRWRVLIVEDHVDLARLLALSFELDGHEVRLAYDGAQGVALARAWAPDVMICDIGLPVIDGYEVARQVRASARPPRWLIAVTAYATAQDRERAAFAGFDRHVAKPVSARELIALLAQMEAAQRPPAHREAARLNAG